MNDSSPAPLDAALAALKASSAPNGSPATPPEIREYKGGETLFSEGEDSHDLFMLMEGAVEIYVGNQKMTKIDTVGTYLGEGAALLGLPRTATVRALKPSKFLVFSDIRYLFEQDPEFGRKLSVTLARRLAQTNERIEHVMQVLHQARISPEVIDSVKRAFAGK